MRRAVEFASTVDRLLSDVEHNMMMDDGDNPTRRLGSWGRFEGTRLAKVRRTQRRMATRIGVETYLIDFDTNRRTDGEVRIDIDPKGVVSEM